MKTQILHVVRTSNHPIYGDCYDCFDLSNRISPRYAATQEQVKAWLLRARSYYAQTKFISPSGERVKYTTQVIYR